MLKGDWEVLLNVIDEVNNWMSLLRLSVLQFQTSKLRRSERQIKIANALCSSDAIYNQRVIHKFVCIQLTVPAIFPITALTLETLVTYISIGECTAQLFYFTVT